MKSKYFNTPTKNTPPKLFDGKNKANGKQSANSDRPHSKAPSPFKLQLSKKKSPKTQNDVNSLVAAQKETIEKLSNEVSDMKKMMFELVEVVKTQQQQLAATPVRTPVTIRTPVVFDSTGFKMVPRQLDYSAEESSDSESDVSKESSDLEVDSADVNMDSASDYEREEEEEQPNIEHNEQEEEDEEEPLKRRKKTTEEQIEERVVTSTPEEKIDESEEDRETEEESEEKEEGSESEQDYKSHFIAHKNGNCSDFSGENKANGLPKPVEERYDDDLIEPWGERDDDYAPVKKKHRPDVIHRTPKKVSPRKEEKEQEEPETPSHPEATRLFLEKLNALMPLGGGSIMDSDSESPEIVKTKPALFPSSSTSKDPKYQMIERLLNDKIIEFEEEWEKKKKPQMPLKSYWKKVNHNKIFVEKSKDEREHLEAQLELLKKEIISAHRNSGEKAIIKASESLRETVYRICELDTILSLEGGPEPDARPKPSVKKDSKKKNVNKDEDNNDEPRENLDEYEDDGFIVFDDDEEEAGQKQQSLAIDVDDTPLPHNEDSQMTLEVEEEEEDFFTRKPQPQSEIPVISLEDADTQEPEEIEEEAEQTKPKQRQKEIEEEDDFLKVDLNRGPLVDDIIIDTPTELVTSNRKEKPKAKEKPSKPLPPKSSDKYDPFFGEEEEVEVEPKKIGKEEEEEEPFSYKKSKELIEDKDSEKKKRKRFKFISNRDLARQVVDLYKKVMHDPCYSISEEPSFVRKTLLRYIKWQRIEETQHSEEPSPSPSSSTPKKKKLTKIMDESNLSKETRDAMAKEKQRQEDIERNKKRRAEKENRLDLSSSTPSSKSKGFQPYPQIEVNQSRNVDEENPIYLHGELARVVKPHQIESIQFMWENVVNGKHSSGCLLALEMGLGKTLCAIAFVHTFITQNVGKHVLILVPKSVQQIWYLEFGKWLTDDHKPKLYSLTTDIAKSERLSYVRSWHKYKENRGAVMLIGHDLYKLVIMGRKKKQDMKDGKKEGEKEPEKEEDDKETEKFREYLLNADLVIVDEAHEFKNPNSAKSIALKKIATLRRICLTGSPVQNNLIEYWCMVDFVKPSYLGTREEFQNRFQNPITYGNQPDASPEAKKLGKYRLHILYIQLKAFVFRKDISVIKTDLPSKYEITIKCKLSSVQEKLYLKYLESGKADLWSGKNTLCLLGNHPKILQASSELKRKKKKIDEDEDLEVDDAWIQDTLSAEQDIGDLTLSTKMVVLMKILEECKAINEPVLVFSVSLRALDYIEECLKANPHLRYLRMEGKDRISQREQKIDQFNNKKNGINVFIISIHTGSLGVNLTAATRVVLLDMHWNPTHNVQAAARAYRLGQKKDVFIYRLINAGTIEEKLYDMESNKEILSKKVVDKQNGITRSGIPKSYLEYNMPIFEEVNIASDIKDPVIDALKNTEEPIKLSQNIFKIELHDFLLRPDEELNETERLEAEEEYKQSLDATKRHESLMAEMQRQRQQKQEQQQQIIRDQQKAVEQLHLQREQQQQQQKVTEPPSQQQPNTTNQQQPQIEQQQKVIEPPSTHYARFASFKKPNTELKAAPRPTSEFLLAQHVPSSGYKGPIYMPFNILGHHAGAPYDLLTRAFFDVNNNNNVPRNTFIAPPNLQMIPPRTKMAVATPPKPPSVDKPPASATEPTPAVQTVVAPAQEPAMPQPTKSNEPIEID